MTRLSSSVGVYTILDTASSDILISSLWFDSFAEKLFGHVGKDFEYNDGRVYSSCAVSYPNIYFMINGFWLQIQPEDYVVKLTDILCTFKIRPFDAPFNILGMPAFMGYYVTHGWGSGYLPERRMPINSFENF